MKTVRGRFAITAILLIIYSAALVLCVSVLLMFFLSATEPDGFALMVERIFEVFNGSDGFDVRLTRYMVLWGVLGAAGMFVGVILAFKYIYRTLVRPLDDIRMSAANIAEGDLDFEIMAYDTKELAELSDSLLSIKNMLKDGAKGYDEDKERRSMVMANVSHDLRTPVTSIKGYLEGIKDGVANTEEKKMRYLETAYSKTLVLERLLDNLTTYSELELGRMQYHFEFIDIVPYLNDLACEYRSEIPLKGLTFTYDMLIGEEELFIVGDRVKLKRVFDNLISNAIKHAGEDVEISLTAEADSKGVLMCVADTGKGISPDDLKNIFNQFYRGDAARTGVTGSGLGLAIAREIIESHHGKLWARSEQGRGTDFYIYIPLRRRDEI